MSNILNRQIEKLTTRKCNSYWKKGSWIFFSDVHWRRLTLSLVLSFHFTSGTLWARTELPESSRVIPDSNRTYPTSQTPDPNKKDEAKKQEKDPEPRNAPTISQPTGPDIQEAARRASNRQGTTMQIATVAAGIAATAAAVCAAQCPKGCCKLAPKWALGAALSGVTAMMMSMAMSKSNASVIDTSGGGIINPPPGDGGVAGPGNGTPGDNPDNTKPMVATKPNFKKPQEELDKVCAKTKTCVNLEKGTLTTPDGKTVDLAKASEGDLAAAGLDRSAIDQVRALTDQAFKEAEKKLASGTDKALGDLFESQEAQTGRMGNMDIDSGFDPQSILAQNAANKGSTSNRDPSAVAGLSKNFNGDPIGVAEENIFTLINRRYELQAQKQELRGVQPTP
ncbi:MAG: hypothetical protein N2Z70_00195 [Bdellovibrionaceae bacterium]|jgi:hypothetical protein|nr:hypothetical protein [Pseudobdellovibrionaceae bacterium]